MKALEKVGTFQLDQKEISKLEFSPDSSFLLAASGQVKEVWPPRRSHVAILDTRTFKFNFFEAQTGGISNAEIDWSERILLRESKRF